ncbi:MAG: ABC transporter permease [Vampirovibrio sp.]|nr:ABC transporter permease [Vampirovibrio sp.]
MIQLVLKRLFTGIITLWVVMSATFFLLRFLPGGPFDAERKLPPEIQANIEATYHLDEPVWVQYGYFLGDIVQGDLGPSFKYRSRRVNAIVAESAGISILLGSLALLIGTVLGVLAGTWAGVSKRPWVDGVLSILGLSTLSLPSFIFGGLLVLVFALHLGILPAATLQTPAHYVLPVVSLSLVPFAYAFLLVRTSVKETKLQPFILIKKSYGLPDGQVTYLHILRNSFVPLLSILGPLAAAIITGSFAIEYIFAIPGMGKHFVTAVTNRDYTLVMGITVVYSMLLIGFNTVSDILYGLLDPRLRDVGENSV